MSGFRFLFVVSFAAMLLMVGVGMIVALLPQRVLDMSGSLRDVGYIASVFAISYLMLQLPFGTLADRLGAKPFLVTGYALCAVSGLVFFSAGSVDGLLLGRFVQGAGEAPIWALGPALLSLAYPHAKGRVIGIYNAAIHAGLTIGPLSGLLLLSFAPAGTAFLVFAGLCLAGGVTVLLFLPHTKTPSDLVLARAPQLRDLTGLLRARDPLITLAGICLYGAGYGIFVSVLPGFLSLHKGFGAQATGILFALFYVAISVSQLIVGPLSDRHGRRAYMIAGLAMAALGFGAFPWLAHPWVYLPLTVASFGLGVFCVSSMAYLNECVPASLQASVSSSYYLAWGTGYFLGPLVVGWFGGSGDAQAAYMLLAILIAGQAGLLCLMRKKPPGKT